MLSPHGRSWKEPRFAYDTSLYAWDMSIDQQGRFDRDLEDPTVGDMYTVYL